MTYWIGDAADARSRQPVDEALEGLPLPEPGGDLGTPDFGEPPALDLE